MKQSYGHKQIISNNIRWCQFMYGCGGSFGL